MVKENVEMNNKDFAKYEKLKEMVEKLCDKVGCDAEQIIEMLEEDLVGGD